MSILSEKKTASTEIYKGKIVTLKRDTAELENGKQVIREVVEHFDGVVIAAEINGKIIFVKQFRYPLQEVLYELPAGKLDSEKEDVLSAAKRELEEETGYVSQNWKNLGYVWSSPGFCTERIYIFKASGLSFKGQHLDEDEFLDVELIEKDKVFDMIKQGVINDAKSVAAVMKAYKL